MKKILKLFSIAMLLILFTPNADATTTVTGSGTNIFANGISIAIDDEVPTNGTLATIDGFTATGADAYISWTEGQNTKYVGVAKTTTVYGGSDGSSQVVTVASTNITMTGGQIYYLYGGNLGADNTAKDSVLDPASTVTENVTVNITGGKVTRVYGGGKLNAAVDGTITINVSNVVFVPDTNTWSYLIGGVHGNGNEGIIEVNNRKILTNAVVNKANINVKNTTVSTAMIGGGGYTKVNEGTLTIGDGNGTADTIITEVYSGGVHGSTGTGTVTINSDADIESISATNRGYIENSKYIINGGSIDNINTGATPGAFNIDGNNASAINGKAEIIINDANGITNAYITPSINKRIGDISYYEVYIPTLTLTNNDKNNAVDFKLMKYTASNNIEALKDLTDYVVADSKTLTLNGNLKLTVPANFKLINEGAIVNNATIVNTGTIDNENGTINTGSTGVTPTENISGDAPKVVQEGNKQTYDVTKNKDKGLVIEFSGVLGEDFTVEEGKVYVDGKIVDPKNYTVTEGSVIITLKPSFLSTLPEGNHTIKLVYDNESFAEASFVAINTNPQTFDGVLIYSIIAILSLLALGIVANKVKCAKINI